MANRFVCQRGVLHSIAVIPLSLFSRCPQTLVTPRKFVLFGTPIDRVTLDEAVHRIESFLDARVPAIVCTSDTTAIWRAQRDQKLREVYSEADLVTPDGMGVVWAGRLLGAPFQERVSGIDLLEKLFSCGRALKIFLLGGAPGVADQAAHKLSERYPNLQIVGTHHGYFRPSESDRITELIEAAQPDMVLVGLGVPRQELWMRAKPTEDPHGRAHGGRGVLRCVGRGAAACAAELAARRAGVALSALAGAQAACPRQHDPSLCRADRVDKARAACERLGQGF
jgi:N-acetylglucosaminyldiphosphoundecaprenol N-acetyl-beta-D-mannosaminyltransferase